MSTSQSTIDVIDAEGGPQLAHAKGLFQAYADEFAALIADSLCFQGFEAELAALPGRYAPPSGCLLLAMVGETPAGCVALRDLGEGTCEMKRLYVPPEYRGHGVGRLLVAAVLQRAEEAGYRRMVLDTLPEMADAVALYRRHGFTDTARYWDNPIERTIYLEKPLGTGHSNTGSPLNMNEASLAEVIQDGMAAYYEHLAARVERFVRMLTDHELWAKPFPFGNSVGHLVVHLTGNLNHYIGAKVAETGYIRHREAEFTDPTRPATADLLDAFRKAVAMVVQTLSEQGEDGLTTPVANADVPVRDRFGLFLVCAAHLNNHIGQMAYLVQAHGRGLDDKVW